MFSINQTNKQQPILISLELTQVVYLNKDKGYNISVLIEYWIGLCVCEEKCYGQWNY
jgi:hypothetical protein